MIDYIAWAGLIIVPVAGWLTNKQLEVNKKVNDHEQAISDLKDNSEHTRSRVDAIYEHLIERPGSRTDPR